MSIDWIIRDPWVDRKGHLSPEEFERLIVQGRKGFDFDLVLQVALEFVGGRRFLEHDPGKGWFIIDLLDKPTNPSAIMFPPRECPDGTTVGEMMWSRRCIDVSVLEDEPEQQAVMLTTRRADEFTNAVAQGLAKCIARLWSAELVEPS